MLTCYVGFHVRTVPHTCMCYCNGHWPRYSDLCSSAVVCMWNYEIDEQSSITLHL